MIPWAQKEKRSLKQSGEQKGSSPVHLNRSVYDLSFC